MPLLCTGDEACNFFEKLLHHTGEWYGEPFIPISWQEEALYAIFDPRREIREAYLEIVKKSGKTEFCAALTILFLTLEPSHGCEIYGAASAQRQALNVYRAATSMVDQSAFLKGELIVRRSTHRILKRSDPNSFYAAIAADGDLTDGVNPKFVIADELHRWKTRKQIENWDVLRLGGIARKQNTLTVAITTAGVINESPLAWRLHEKTRRIEEGVVSDPTFYGRIYGADPKDDWTDEATWIKANPSLKQNGGFLELSKIRTEYEASLSDPDSQVAFKRYYLNLWDQKANRAIDMNQWRASKSEWIAEGWPWSHDFLARFVDRRCWIGVDLSMTTDMSAVTLVFPADDGVYEVLPFYWMPQDGLKKAEIRDGMPYGRWAEEGYLDLSEGQAINYADVKARLKWAAEMFDVQEFCFDRFNSREMSVSLVGDGLKCIEVPQNFTGLSEGTKKLLRLISEAKLYHGAHPILAFNAQCLCTKSDGNDLVRPVKPDREKESSRIDGLAAGITALSRAVVFESRATPGMILI